ncbi:claudin 18 [Rhinolophus ferrumequinum]|uniref:Claudin n=1 Tax=Rhinolophus ferrumequinum TaxID=59479 RepID=A0A7J7UIN9_RHIFE|nr:claudin 18 [Rhinolophus ferrumequinum]
MAVTACQGLGFVVSLTGIAGIIAATCMDQWSTQDLYNNPVTAVFNYQGLWRSCVRESSGFTECRGYFTLLGLPGRMPKISPRLAWVHAELETMKERISQGLTLCHMEHLGNI